MVEKIKQEVKERWDDCARRYKNNPTEATAVKMNTYREVLSLIGAIEEEEKEPRDIFEALERREKDEQI